MPSKTQYHTDCATCGKHVQKTMPVIKVADLNGPLRVRCNKCRTINPIENREILS